MPLIDATGLRVDEFVRVGEADPLPEAGAVLLPLARLAAEGATVLACGGRLGVVLPNTTRVEAIAPWMARLSLVAIGFPSFSDGRGFSIARRLRHLGYGGTLRASGALIADQMRHALGCGFDEIEVADAIFARQPTEQWLDALLLVTLRYQRGSAQGRRIPELRQAARGATHSANRSKAHAV